ncbi:MAG: hypothetical protein O7B25_05750 [Gammaproteobacteria bacterium]|nr:hypothetical protein [Gammaproteobacteria bacterium]
MHITLVKKILANGEPCRKCNDVEARLRNSGAWERIDEVVIADERDPQSPGMRLASDLKVERAPFFVVTEDGEQRVYTVYFKFVKEVLDQSVNPQQAAAEILADNPSLDFI